MYRPEPDSLVTRYLELSHIIFSGGNLPNRIRIIQLPDIWNCLILRYLIEICRTRNGLYGYRISGAVLNILYGGNLPDRNRIIRLPDIWSCLILFYLVDICRNGTGLSVYRISGAVLYYIIWWKFAELDPEYPFTGYLVLSYINVSNRNLPNWIRIIRLPDIWYSLIMKSGGNWSDRFKIIWLLDIW